MAGKTLNDLDNAIAFVAAHKFLLRQGADTSDVAGTVAQMHSFIKATKAEFTKSQNFDEQTLTALGADLVTNGAFASDTSWTKGTGWTIGSGVASSDGTQSADADLTQNVSAVNGQVYQVIYTISNFSAGNVVAVVGDTEGADTAANVTVTEYITAGAGTDIDIRADLDFIGDIDNVSVKLTNISWNLENEQVSELTLDGNAIIDTPTNMEDGMTAILTVKQDAVGSRTVTWSSAFEWPGGTAPALSTAVNAVDIISFISDGSVMRGVFQGDFK